MSNYIMNVDVFGNEVLAETDGCMVSLNGLTNAGNAWRLTHGMPIYQLAYFLESKLLKEYLEAAAEVWGIPVSSFLKKAGKGKTSRTMAHVSVAIFKSLVLLPSNVPIRE